MLLSRDETSFARGMLDLYLGTPGRKTRLSLRSDKRA